MYTDRDIQLTKEKVRGGAKIHDRILESAGPQSGIGTARGW